jgi:hypothetical protein
MKVLDARLCLTLETPGVKEKTKNLILAFLCVPRSLRLGVETSITNHPRLFNTEVQRMRRRRE